VMHRSRGRIRKTSVNAHTWGICRWSNYVFLRAHVWFSLGRRLSKSQLGTKA
jgi:hypothetical protein